MADSAERPPSFPLARRGYDRDAVDQQLRRFNTDLHLVATDRDSAVSHARELTTHLEQAREEIERLRREVDKLAVPPTTAAGMSERLSRMLQLASDEASEIRATAQSEADELRSVAQQAAKTAKEEAAAAHSAAAADIDRRNAELSPLGRARPRIDARRMARRELTRIAARDGLGLPVYLTRPAGTGPWPTVVLAHGGTIEVESQHGEGTTITIILPYDCERTSAAPPGDSPPPEPGEPAPTSDDSDDSSDRSA